VLGSALRSLTSTPADGRRLGSLADPTGFQCGQVALVGASAYVLGDWSVRGADFGDLAPGIENYNHDCSSRSRACRLTMGQADRQGDLLRTTTRFCDEALVLLRVAGAVLAARLRPVLSGRDDYASTAKLRIDWDDRLTR
jgi:hypothetical protein